MLKKTKIKDNKWKDMEVRTGYLTPKKKISYFELILFIVFLSPVYLSINNKINGIKIEPAHIHEQIEPWYIWEDQDRFGTAFKVARALLGPEGIFTWNGNDYTTQYKEEL